MTGPSDSLDQLMDSGETELPQFATVMRGYDRGQVDDYVARLNDFLADAEQRAQRAERSVADVIRRNERLTEELRQAIDRRQHMRAGEPYEGLGERIEHMLRLAGEEADNIREQARIEAEEIVADARRSGDTEREAAERDLTAVSERRDAVVSELRRVQEVLATLGLRQAPADEASIDGSTPPEAVDLTATQPAAAGGDAEVSDPDATRVIQLPSAASSA
ncbi:MAG TPA: DivIVA domain-containing protein [Mycobacteriales bacterium]|nr:DivIVA domain-containing protein [Mycobacteriales bacterium]